MLQLIPTLLIATTVHAETSTVSARTACAKVYAESEVLKTVLGDTQDDQLAPAIDEWLSTYLKDYRDTPSYETYVERLKANDFKGDFHAAYALMQGFSSEASARRFKEILNTIIAAEKLVGPLSGYAEPVDPAGLRYTRCLREYVSKSLRDLPENSYYEFDRAQILSPIESYPAPVNAGGDAGSKATR